MTGPDTRVPRLADWAVGPDRDDNGHAPAPVHEVQCKECDELSDPSPEQGTTDRWALKHAGLTGHRTYREITTAPLVVFPAPTNPLIEQENGW
jgi:hypothetical protein